MKNRILLGLAAAFWARVLAQAVQHQWDVSWLPDFDSWQSGAVSYASLVALQVLMIAFQLVVLWAVYTDRFRGHQTVRFGLIAIGVLYFGFMVFRLIAGATFLSGDDWFDVPLPTVFHLVLAAFVIVAGLSFSVTDKKSEAVA